MGITEDVRERIRNVRISWPGVLLFAALLAQSPHAGLVFLRNADGHIGLEYALACVGAIVYAVALEGATAYFVWKRARRLAAAFAVFSILHNVAYYLPGAWAFNAWGADMVVRNVMGAVLISLSLPVAIAAFSHTAHAGTQAQSADADEAQDAGTQAQGPARSHAQTVDVYAQTQAQAQTQTEEPTAQDAAQTQDAGARLTPKQRRLHIKESGIDDPAQIAAQYGVKLRTAQDDLAKVRSGLVTQNGVAHA